jgi:hypothetical protein
MLFVVIATVAKHGLAHVSGAQTAPVLNDFTLDAYKTAVQPPMGDECVAR